MGMVIPMNLIFGNYGNQTIAAVQWALEAQLTDVYVISVDTGWAASEWQVQVNAAEAFAKQCGFQVVRLHSKPKFDALMQDRREFPSTKFQWCAGFLKGLALLDWLDEYDKKGLATIILGKRRADSRANFDLAEYIEESEHYGDRKVWYPLYKTDDVEFERLITASGLELLSHRSLECDPCVNSYGADLARVSEDTMSRTHKLEQSVGKTMFEIPIETMVKQARANLKAEPAKSRKYSAEMFDMGCGSPFACGE